MFDTPNLKRRCVTLLDLLLTTETHRNGTVVLQTGGSSFRNDLWLSSDIKHLNTDKLNVAILLSYSYDISLS